MRSSSRPMPRCGSQPTADGHLALRRRPKDGIDLAFDDAARIHLHVDFRFIAGFDVAQFVLPVEC